MKDLFKYTKFKNTKFKYTKLNLTVMKKMAFKGLLLLAVLPFVTVACDSNDDKGSEEITVIVMPEGTRSITETGNGFSFKLFNEFRNANPGNLVLSPFSVMTDLAMLANGDDGASRDEILRALNMTDSQTDIDNFNAYCSTLLSQLPGVDRKVELNFANSIWNAPYAASLNDDFVSTLSDVFSAELVMKSPEGEEGRRAVNSWVRKATDGNIAEFLQNPYPDGTTTALIDAVYFKGGWSEKFDRSKTAPGIFHNADGSDSEVDFMNRKAVFNYMPLDDMRAICLPYGNGNFNMIIVMPEGDNNLDRLASTIDDDIITRLNGSDCDRMDVELYMPKFECHTNNSIFEIMREKFGITRAFEPEAGLNRVYSSANFVVAKFHHAASIIVDEDGSVAASATGIAGGFTSPGYAMDVMRVDRPFIFLITESTTNTILFIGQITNL